MDRKKRRMNRFEQFAERLAMLGYASYDAYLYSTEWAAFKKAYAESSMPHKCVGCESSDYILHHTNYERVGGELLHDVVPLCEDCHTKIHQWEKRGGGQISQIHKFLVEGIGLTQCEAQRRLMPFCIARKKAAKAVPRCVDCRKPLKANAVGLRCYWCAASRKPSRPRQAVAIAKPPKPEKPAGQQRCRICNKVRHYTRLNRDRACEKCVKSMAYAEWLATQGSTT